MDRLRVLIFWLLVPALAVLFALPVFLVHVAVHILMDRMRRGDLEDASTGARRRLSGPVPPSGRRLPFRKASRAT